MTNFGDWKDKEFECIYNTFKKDQDMKLAIDETKFWRALEKHSNDKAPNEFSRKPYYWRRNYINGLLFGDKKNNVKVPCMSCGQNTKNRNNHTYPRHLIKKYLSQDGHVYGFQMAPKKDEKIRIADEISSDKVSDIDKWRFRDLKLKCQGINQSASIFHGFCSRCDDQVFKNADSKRRDKQAIAEQVYRVLCSTYYKSLDHIVKLRYVKEKEEEFGFRVGDYSLDVKLQNPSTKKEMGVMSKHICDLLATSYKLYDLLLYFKQALSCPERVHYWCGVVKVKIPSVACSFILLEEKNYEIKTNIISRIVDYVGTLGLIYPISKTELFFCFSGLPLGIDPPQALLSRYGSIADRKGTRIALSKIVLENLWSTKNLVMSPEFYRSLSEQEEDTICAYPYIKEQDNVPDVNLFSL